MPASSGGNTVAARPPGRSTTPHPGRWPVISWAVWDCGGAAFNAVVTTFVFTVYLTGSTFVDPALVSARLVETDPTGPAHIATADAEAALSSGLGWGIAAASFIVALVAPVLGQRSDASGRRKLWLGVNTALVIVASALLFFVRGEPPFYLLGVLLIAAGTVFYEIAMVNYNAMLAQVSTPATIGKVSGLGWGFGYLGGIILLVVVYFGVIVDTGVPGHGGLLMISEAEGLNIRVIALIAAGWTLVFSLPVLFAVPEIAPSHRHVKVGFFRSYVVLAHDVKKLWKESRTTLQFLIASALFRDGLVGIFTFGGLLAQGTFGFTAGEVIIFAIVANFIAGVSTFISGVLDDRFGPKPIIVISLASLLAIGTAVFIAHDGGALTFWIGGTLLCVFVGPAQSASRTFLARVTPRGREAEVFGLYATTGRAVSPLAPALFSIFIAVLGAQFWGILGILLVLLTGLLLLLPVTPPPRMRG
jgi:UMF1 family MFS transporter